MWDAVVAKQGIVYRVYPAKRKLPLGCIVYKETDRGREADVCEGKGKG